MSLTSLVVADLGSVADTALSALLAFVGFAILIILHEAGHFTAAKAVGMKVEKFYLFFPPKAKAIQRGETEYGIGWVPLGGYVKIAGMNPAEEVPEEDAHRTYYAAPVWKRIVVIAAGPLVNLVIAFVILFSLALTVKEPTALAVGGVETGTPAEGQLQPGDQILSIEGTTPGQGTLDDQATRLTNGLAGFECSGEKTDLCDATKPAEVVVDRDGSEKTLELTPFYDSEADRFRLGFRFEGTNYVPTDVSIGEAADRSVDFMWRVTSATVGVITRIFEAEQRKQISGVVGSYEATRQAIQLDARTAITFLGIISLSLAIINLFPFLPLDGGHIFWSIVEKIRGRPVPFSWMERASVIGFALVAVLFVIGLTNDIGRLTGEGLGIR